MEDLLGLLAFVVFMGISIVAKIINSKKKEDILTSAMTPQQRAIIKKRQNPASPPRPVRKTVSQNLQQYATPTPEPPEQQPFLETQHEMTKRKSLIQEEPGSVAKREKTESTTEIPRLPAETSVSSYQSMTEALKSNRKFTIICHEILGKPKALED